MSYQYHGTTNLITLPGREVQTFPSGLVRITRTYVCRKGLEGQFRQLLAEGSVLPNDDAAPCIDGAYIFPAPIENIRDDGFVEFRATAYGRSNTTGTQRENLQTVQAGQSTNLVANLILEIVLPSVTAREDLTVSSEYETIIASQNFFGFFTEFTIEYRVVIPNTSSSQFSRSVGVQGGGGTALTRFFGRYIL